VQDRVELIEADALNDEAAAHPLRLIQVTSAEVFNQAHIPGALLVTPQELVSGEPPASGRLPDRARLNLLFSRIGYEPKQNFVLYDDEGGGWAGRFAWTLDIIGHRNWRYLNGGLHAWAHLGLPLEAGPPKNPTPTTVDVGIDVTPIAEITDVLGAIDDGNTVIWDVRSREEYTGERQSSARGGHIPGAINLDWLALKDPARQQRVSQQLETMLAERGIDGSRRIITHCQTHHRSGLSYMLCRLLGWDVRAYHGSWSEWGNRDDTPVSIGDE